MSFMDGFCIIISLQFSYIKSVLFGISCVLKLLPVEISIITVSAPGKHTYSQSLFSNIGMSFKFRWH